MSVLPDRFELGPRPTCPIPMDGRHEFLHAFPSRHFSPTDEAIVEAWRVHFEKTGLAYRADVDEQGRMRQLYIHRLIDGRWCCRGGGQSWA